MSVLLALVAATSYGLSDFVGGVFSKRVSPWAVAFLVQVTGALLVLTLTLAVDGSPTRTDLLWGVVGGIGNGFGTAFLYRGLSSGRMGVIAPVSGVGAALVPILAGLVAGERPSSIVWLGVLVALPAIWLVSREPSGEDAPSAVGGSGLVDGVLAGLGFGTLFAALGQIPGSAGLLPLVVNQVVAGIVIVAIATALGAPWVPREARALAGAACGALGAVGTCCFLLAAQGGLLTVTAVIASLYPAVTVLLAATVLRERVHLAQGLGLALCAVAVTLVAVG